MIGDERPLDTWLRVSPCLYTARVVKVVAVVQPTVSAADQAKSFLGWFMRGLHQAGNCSRVSP